MYFIVYEGKYLTNLTNCLFEFMIIIISYILMCFLVFDLHKYHIICTFSVSKLVLCNMTRAKYWAQCPIAFKFCIDIDCKDTWYKYCIQLQRFFFQKKQIKMQKRRIFAYFYYCYCLFLLTFSTRVDKTTQLKPNEKNIHLDILICQIYYRLLKCKASRIAAVLEFFIETM